VDTGNDSPLDGIASEIGHKAACATPPTCAVLSGVSSSNEVMVQNHMIGHEKAVGYIDATTIPQKRSDSDCLNLDQFLNRIRTCRMAQLGTNAKRWEISRTCGSDMAENVRVGIGCQDIDHSVRRTEDVSTDEFGVGYGSPISDGQGSDVDNAEG